MNFSADTLSSDYFQMDYLFQQGGLSEIGKWNEIQTKYTIDEKSISFQTIEGKLCVAMIAYHK